MHHPPRPPSIFLPQIRPPEASARNRRTALPGPREHLDLLLTASFWAAVLRIASPLIFATMGELICERAGVLNLGIEGTMVAGAFTGWIAVYAGLPLWAGIATALLAGTAFGLLHGFGFAGALVDLGLPQGDVPLALLFFNVGVETGQLLFIAAILAAAASARRIFAIPRRAPLAAAYGIGTLAAFWGFERLDAMFF